MKTYTNLRQNSSYFYLIGLLSFLLASCGSYQNTSYYDNDGVYGKSTNTYAQTTTTGVNNQYKDYFKSLQDENQPTEIFTDVDNYGNYAVNDSTQTASVAYPAWGSGTTETSVTYYSSPTWSFGIGFGWGYPYYGYGWGYPYYGWGYYPGWGYPGWGYPGWGYPGYGYYGNYSYSYGRRGSAAYYGSRGYAYRNSSYAGRNYAGRSYAGNNFTTRNYAGRSSYSTNNGRSYSDYRRSSSVNGRTYSSPTFTDRRGTVQGQSSGYDYANRRSSAGATNRSYSTPNSSSSRTYSPSPSRSMNSGGGSMRSSGGGGGYSGGGGGGGRSYGGGGGGGRR
ncbi:hypothetical protein [Flavobacterium sp. KACC 22761]|uniref:hypothetical protein n=1 Tax=Flavobacterium sp. KACC 22761 TaxID=3092665 RepID=UPI002A748FFD|nr:hypothetical protein [Flavobacterium sp. KACC 22761]WPO79024.1 hypothetical protein SCB73_01265 [Flavobacterium sp. KACC 22761]